MAFDPKSLESRIYGILRDPNVDFDQISAKKVRATLSEQTPELAETLKTHKAAVDEVILVSYHVVRAERNGEADEAQSADEARPANGDLNGAPPSSQPVPLKEKKPKSRTKKEEDSDAEMARQLHEMINGGGRSSRSGVSSSSRRKSSHATSSGGGRKSKKVKLSQDYIEDSDEDLSGSGSPAPTKQKKKRAKKESDISEDEENSDDSDVKPAKKRRRKSEGGSTRGGAFNAEQSLSPELAAICGTSQCSRPQVVKRIWEYIKENNLQDPRDKRKILCDDQMQAVMGSKTVTMFSMNKHLGKHLWPLEA